MRFRIANRGDSFRVPVVNVTPTGQRLTPQETRVLVGIAEGQSDHEIALRLAVSMGAVRYAARMIIVKLGAANRPNAVTIALATRVIALGRDDDEVD